MVPTAVGDMPEPSGGMPVPKPGADVCTGCGGALTLQALIALGSSWHPECFVCSICTKPFDGEAFVAHEGKPMHKACFAAAHGPKCSKCGLPISGSAVIVEGKKMHPECFTCTTCSCVLEGRYGLGQDQQPYCAKHLAAALPTPTVTLGGSRDYEGSDPFTVDVRTGEKVYVESETRRKYRMGEDGVKKYDDERPKPKYGGGTTWRVS